MAICNLFRQFSKDTGNFIMFEQYANDLTKCFVQHDNYDVIPSKFVALDINYSNLNAALRQPTATTDLNAALPTYMQNYYENGCAWLKNDILNSDSEKEWSSSDWSAKVSSNIFWNALYHGGLIHISKYDNGWVKNSTDLDEVVESYDAIEEVRYIGNIEIHSYEEKDGIGYSELYCYVPNDAVRTLYKVTTLTKSPSYYSYEDKYVQGYDENSENILGILPTKVEGLHIPYYYNQDFTFAGYEVDPGSNSEVDYDGSANLRGLTEYSKKYYPNNPTSNYFKFNTVVILYDIVVRDSKGNISILHKDIPLGMYLTGLINTDGSVSNEVVKYEQSVDAYNSGTSYGLRVCTRYTSTPNATTINSVELDLADQYGGFSQAMNKMAESQEKMDEIINEVINNSQFYKEHLAMFRNNRTNCPYIRKIGDDYIWFINGKSTGVPANGHKGDDGLDGTLIECKEDIDGSWWWYVDGIKKCKANGTDGIQGPQGPQGPQGKDGTTPTVVINSDGNWVINSKDTGITAKADTVSIEKASDGHQYWAINGNKTSFKVDVEDGSTPEIKDVNGTKYWFINGQNTSIVAEGVDGHSIHVSRSVPKIYNGVVYMAAMLDTWNIDDLILYTGSSGVGYSQYDLYYVDSFSTSYNKWKLSLLGNLHGDISDFISKISMKGIKGGSKITIENSKGTKYDFKVSTPKKYRYQYSSMQRWYMNINDTIYYCGKYGNKDRNHSNNDLLEIPYSLQYTKDVDNTYTVNIVVPEKYRDCRGVLKIGRTKLNLNNKLAFSTTQKWDGTKWIERDTNYDMAGLYQQLPPIYSKLDGTGTPGRLIYKFAYDENCIRTIKSGVITIWEKITKSELDAIRNAYNISKHIGKVHLYVPIEDLATKKYNDEPISDISSLDVPGTLSYNSITSNWALNPDPNVAYVEKHKKIVSGKNHTGAEDHYWASKPKFRMVKTIGIAEEEEEKDKQEAQNSFDKFFDRYPLENMLIYMKTGSPGGSNSDFHQEMRWVRNLRKRHLDPGGERQDTTHLQTYDPGRQYVKSSLRWDGRLYGETLRTKLLAEEAKPAIYSIQGLVFRLNRNDNNDIYPNSYVFVGGQTIKGGKTDIYKIQLTNCRGKESTAKSKIWSIRYIKTIDDIKNPV